MVHKLLIVLILLCAIPARGAIANAGSCSASATSCTLSATATGDLNVFWAYHAGSVTVPTLPSGMTKIGTFPASPTTTTGVALLYCKLASSGADTGSGTATNATAVAGLSYSGTSAPANLSASCAGMAVAEGAFNNATSSATATFKALTLLGSSNWIGAFVGASTSGDTCATPPTGLTSRSAIGDVRAWDSNGVVSSWAQQTCSLGGTVNHIEVVFAILAPPVLATGSNPQLKRDYGIFSSFNNGATSTTFQQYMDPSGPREAVAGDLAVIGVYFPSGDTLTISDSTGGSNTWTQDATNTDAGTTTTFRIYHSILSAAITSVTFTTSAATCCLKAGIKIFYNVATSSIVDGTATCASAIAPASNFGSTIQPGAITTTASGDLIVQFIFTENGGSGGTSVALLAIAPGDNQQLASADKFLGSGSQYFVQASSGAINPGMSFIETASLPLMTDTYATCAAAYKAGSGGTAPTGAGIVHQQLIYPAGAAGPIVLQFPSSGNFLSVTNDLPKFTANPSDNQSNTWATIANTVAPTTDATIEYSCNATTSNNLTISQPFTSGGNNTLWVLYDVSGMLASSSCLDTGATVPGGADASVLTATSSGASRNGGNQSGTSATQVPSLVPSTGNEELFIQIGSNGLGPTVGFTNATMAYVNGTNSLDDGNSVDNGDHGGYAFSSSTVSVGLTFGGVEVNSYSGVMAAFKEAPVVGGGTVIPSLPMLGVGVGE